MGKGYISINRSIIDKGYYKDSEYIHLWVHLLLKANHKETEFLWNKKIQKIYRGELLAGRKKLSEETGINESKVERILKLLEIEQQIEQQKTTKFRIIKIKNYNKFQDTNNKVNNGRTTSEQQVNTYNNDNNDNNDNKQSNVETLRVYDHFIKEFNKNSNTYKLSDNRKKKISSRLKDTPVEMILSAITNTANSPFHNGDNQRGWKADLEFIIRNYEQVERLSQLEGKNSYWAKAQDGHIFKTKEELDKALNSKEYRYDTRDGEVVFYKN